MQRYSDGLKVPNLMMDVFTGKVSDGAGDISCALRYTPKDINHIIIPPVKDALDRMLTLLPHALVGKTLTVRTYQDVYEKVDTPTGTGNSGGAGADPHSHTISTTWANVTSSTATARTLGAVQVHYTVG